MARPKNGASTGKEIAKIPTKTVPGRVAKKGDAKKDKAKKDEVKQDEPMKVEAKKDEPKKVEPKKDKAKKDEVQKDEPKKDKAKKDEPKKVGVAKKTISKENKKKTHPSYSKMVVQALSVLKNRNGVTLPAIYKHLENEYGVEINKRARHYVHESMGQEFGAGRLKMVNDDSDAIKFNGRFNLIK